MKAYIGPYKEHYKSKWFSWLNKYYNERKVQIKVDSYDLINLDDTMTQLIHPLLVKFRNLEFKGAPFTDNEDVPKQLQMSKAQREQFDSKGKSDPNYYNRWNYIIDEILWSFEQMADPLATDKFYNKEGKGFDLKGSREHDKRIENGLRLFGKYYRAMWL